VKAAVGSFLAQTDLMFRLAGPVVDPRGLIEAKLGGGSSSAVPKRTSTYLLRASLTAAAGFEKRNGLI
jgi:hypothetical protein